MESNKTTKIKDKASVQERFPKGDLKSAAETGSPPFNDVWEGVLYMKRWGKLWLNPQTGAWAVKGKWQAKRQYFSEIPTVGGGWLVCRSKEMAEHLQHQISIEIERGTFNPARFRKAKPLHTGNYARKWLEDQKPTVKFSTWRCYRAYVDHWIEPLLGQEYLPDLSHEKIKRFLNSIPKSAKYKKNIQALLFEILRDARENGYISQVPALIPIKLDQKKIKYIDADTQASVLEKIPARHRPIYAFLFATGCRVSEARALRKVDVQRDCIVIAGTFAPSADGGEVWQIVKQSREEAIPLSEGARIAIEVAGQNLTPYIFINPDTSRVYKKNIYDIWNKACLDSGVGYFPLNNAGRHSLGMALSKAGVDMNQISALLRHSNVSVTKKHYAEHDMGVLKRVVDNVRSIK